MRVSFQDEFFRFREHRNKNFQHQDMWNAGVSEGNTVKRWDRWREHTAKRTSFQTSKLSTQAQQALNQILKMKADNTVSQQVSPANVEHLSSKRMHPYLTSLLTFQFFSGEAVPSAELLQFAHWRCEGGIERVQTQTSKRNPV